MPNEKGFGSKESGVLKKSTKNTLADKFEELTGKVEKLFKSEKVLWTPNDDAFIELISKFRKAGVDFLEINNTTKSAIAKPENFYQYPSIRFVITQDKSGKVKFYKTSYRVEDKDKEAEEITQLEFEDNCIPELIKPNDLLGKDDNEEDREPEDIYDETKEASKKETKDMVTGEDEDKMTEKEEDDPKSVEANTAGSSPKFKAESVQKKTKNLIERIGGQFGSFSYDHGEDDELDPAEDIENFNSVEAAKQIMNLVDTADMEGLAQIYKLVTGKDLDVANNYEFAQGTGEKEAQEIADTIEHMSASDVKFIYDELRSEGSIG